MKKILLMVAGIVLATPFFASAQTLTDLFTDGTQIQSSCVDLKYNLGYRSRDTNTNGEVSNLQEFLVTNGYLSGDPTGYFGTATLAAVKKFQSAVGVGGPTTPGYGAAGPKSRAKIKAMTCDGATTTPVIISNPSSTTTTTVTGCTSNVGFSTTTGKRCSEPRVTTTSIPKVSISLSSTKVRTEEKFSIYWKSVDAESCQVSVLNSSGKEIARGKVDFSGSSTRVIHTGEVVQWSSNPTFVLLCKNTNGVAKASVTLNILDATTIVPPAGCISTVGFSPTTGKACSMTGEMGDPFNTLYICNGVISHDPACSGSATTTPSKITVLFPNGGEEYLLDSDMKVMWSVSNLPAGGYIVAQLVGEGREITLGQTTHQTNTDNYYLSAKNNIVPGKYKVRLHIAGVPENLSAIDSSDGYIMISAITPTLPAIKIISPIGQAYIYRGGSLNVNWSTVGVPDGDINQILIRLRSMDTNQEYNLTTSYNDSSETVIIPASAPNGSYILEIKTSVYGQSYISTSDTTNRGLYLKVIDTPGVL